MALIIILLPDTIPEQLLTYATDKEAYVSKFPNSFLIKEATMEIISVNI